MFTIFQKETNEYCKIRTFKANLRASRIWLGFCGTCPVSKMDIEGIVENILSLKSFACFCHFQSLNYSKTLLYIFIKVQSTKHLQSKKATSLACWNCTRLLNSLTVTVLSLHRYFFEKRGACDLDAKYFEFDFRISRPKIDVPNEYFN